MERRIPLIHHLAHAFSNYVATHEEPSFVKKLHKKRGLEYSYGTDGRGSLEKRMVDLAVAVPAAAAAFPLMAAIAAAIKVDGHIHPENAGPILFWQERIGPNGDILRVPKFRTMKVNADKDPNRMKIVRVCAPGEDPRATRVGRVLRKTPLDELPQLLLLLTGQMHAVNTRPTSLVGLEEMERTMDDFNTYYAGMYVWTANGMTGKYQISPVGHLKQDEKRGPFDNHQFENDSVLYDIGILGATFAYTIDKVAQALRRKQQLDQRATLPTADTPTIEFAPPREPVPVEPARVPNRLYAGVALLGIVIVFGRPKL